MKVIIAIDQSPFGKQVIEAATSRRWHKDTAFKILTVLEPAQWESGTSRIGKIAAEKLAYQRQKLASQNLLDARKMIEDGVPDSVVHIELRQGSARNEIVNSAIDWMSDKILLGAHGKSPNRLFPGSVAQAVARHAICSVDLIRLREPALTERTKPIERLAKVAVKTTQS